MLAARKISVAAPALPTRRVATRLVCKAAQRGEQQEDRLRQALSVPLATMVAATLLASAFVPEEALAARSSGRAGSSAGFSSRKSYSRPSTSSTSPMRRSSTVLPSRNSSTSTKRRSTFMPASTSTIRSNTVMSSSTTVVAPSVIVAPPVYSPFGYGGGFGYSFMPSVVMPFSFFGGFFQLFFLLAIMSVVVSVVKGFVDSSKKDSSKKDDDWGNL